MNLTITLTLTLILNLALIPMIEGTRACALDQPGRVWQWDDIRFLYRTSRRH